VPLNGPNSINKMKHHFYIIAGFTVITLILSITSCKKPEEKFPGKWMEATQLPASERNAASSFVIGTKGYITCGYDGEQYLSDLWEYDSESGTWKQMASLPAASRAKAVAFSVPANGKGYLAMGFNGSAYLNDMWEYDPSANSWNNKASFPGSAVTGSAAFGIGDKGYVVYGLNLSGPVKEFYSYDPVADTWESLTAAPGTARAKCGVLIYDDRAYIMGGSDDNGYYPSDFWRFDPLADSWTQLADISDKTDNSWDDSYFDLTRETPCTFVIDDKGYVTLGKTFYFNLSTTWQYDFTDDRWVRVADFDATVRLEAASFSFGQRGFILTGNHSDQFFRDMWEFIPDAPAEDL